MENITCGGDLHEVKFTEQSGNRMGKERSHDAFRMPASQKITGNISLWLSRNCTGEVIDL